MRIDEVRAKAAARARQLPPPLTDVFERFRADATAFFARVPEPPVYRRRDDPARQAAQALLDEGTELLARAYALGERGDGPTWRLAVDAHLESLCLVAVGNVEAADTVWHQAMQHERKAAGPRRLWTRSDEATPYVFDKATGASRFDPRPESTLTAKLPCPGCRKVSEFAFSHRHASHVVRCPSCRALFTAYLAEARETEAHALSGRVHYTFRLEEFSGTQTRLEVEDSGHDELRASRGDLLAFLYLPENTLRGVLNLDSSRVLWLTNQGFCFVATVAFGAGAPELEVLRRFRDGPLARWAGGRAFVRWYYRRGPALARVVVARPSLKRLVRRGLGVVVAVLSETGT